MRKTLLTDCFRIALCAGFLVAAVASSSSGSEDPPPSSRFAVTLSDPQQRRGRVFLTPLSGMESLGTLCSNTYDFPNNLLMNATFGTDVANVTCTMAGFPSPGGAFAIPNFGDTIYDTLPDAGSVPIYLESLRCSNGAAASYETCLDTGDAAYMEDNVGCTHRNDAGVVCPLLHPGGGTSPSSGVSLGSASILYDAYISAEFESQQPCDMIVPLLSLLYLPPSFNINRLLTSNQPQLGISDPASVCRITVQPLTFVPQSEWTFSDDDLYYFLDRVFSSTELRRAMFPDVVKFARTPNVTWDAYLSAAPTLNGSAYITPAPTAAPASDRIVSAMVSDPAHRRGLVTVLTADGQMGYVCSSFFDAPAANATCTQAGFVSHLGAFALPSWSASIPPQSPVGYLLATAFCVSGSDMLSDCRLSYGSTCFDTVSSFPSGPAGVLCTLPYDGTSHSSSSGSAHPGDANVTIFTVYYPWYQEEPASTFLSMLADLMPIAVRPQLLTVSFVVNSISNPFAAVKVLVRRPDAPPPMTLDAMEAGGLVYDPADIEFALSVYAASNATIRLRLGATYMLVEPNQTIAAVNETPAAPPSTEGPTAAPPSSNIIIGPQIHEWQFRLVDGSSSSIGSPTRGVVRVASPQQPMLWGAVCGTYLSPGALYAVCRKALAIGDSDAWPFQHAPRAIPPTSFMDASALQALDPIVGDVSCVVDAQHSTAAMTSLAGNCSFDYRPHSTGAWCPVHDYLAIDCNPVVIVLEDRTLTAVVLQSTFNETLFQQQWAAEYRVPPSMVVVSGWMQFSQFLYANFTFVDWPSPAHNGSVGGSADAPPPVLLEDTGSQNSMPMPMPGSYSMSGPGSYYGSSQGGPIQPPQHDDVVYDGSYAQLLTFYAANVDAGRLWNAFGVFELRDNTTVPNGNGFTLDRAEWSWRWGVNGSANDETFADFLTKEEIKNGNAHNGSAMIGRPELRIGLDSPWGTVSSRGVTVEDGTAAAFCSLLGAPTAPVAVLPYARYGTGVIYLSEVNCQSFLLERNASCWYNISTKYEKRNDAAHVADLGLLCGNLRPDASAATNISITTRAPPVRETGMFTSTLLQCVSRITSVPQDRMNVTGWRRVNMSIWNTTSHSVDTAEYLTVSFGLLAVPPLLSGSDVLSTGDLLLLINGTNHWAFEDLCGVMWLLMHDGSPDAENGTTTAAPTTAPSTAAPSTTTAAPPTTTVPAGPLGDNFTVTVSDYAGRRGRLFVTPLGGGVTGTVCSNTDGGFYYWKNSFQWQAANVTCTMAGLPSPGGALAIPAFGDSPLDYLPDAQTYPIYLQSVKCNDPVSTTLDTCDAFSPEGRGYMVNNTGCSHNNDAGVVCPLLVSGGGDPSYRQPTSIVYSAYYSNEMQEPCMMFLDGFQYGYIPVQFNFSRLLKSNQAQPNATVCRLTVEPLAVYPSELWSFADDDLYYFFDRFFNSSIVSETQFPSLLEIAREAGVVWDTYLSPAPLYHGSTEAPTSTVTTEANTTTAPPTAANTTTNAPVNTTTEAPSTEASTTTEAPPTEANTTTEAPPTEANTTTEAPPTEANTTTEAPPTEANTTTEAPPTEANTTTAAPNATTTTTAAPNSTNVTTAAPNSTITTRAPLNTTTPAPTSTTVLNTTTAPNTNAPSPNAAVVFVTQSNLTTESLILSVQRALSLSAAPTLVSRSINATTNQSVVVLQFTNATVASSVVQMVANNEIEGVLSAAPLVPISTTPAPTDTTAAPVEVPPSSEEDSGPNTGAIVGGVIGGVAGVALIVVVYKFAFANSTANASHRRFDDDFVMTQGGGNLMSFEELMVKEVDGGGEAGDLSEVVEAEMQPANKEDDVGIVLL